MRSASSPPAVNLPDCTGSNIPKLWEGRTARRFGGIVAALQALRSTPPLLKELSSRVSRRGDPNAEQPPLEVRNVYRFCIRLQIRLARSLSLSQRGATERGRALARLRSNLHCSHPAPLQKEPLCLLRSSDLAHCNLSYGPQSFGKVARSATRRLCNTPPARALDALESSLSLVQLSRARSYSPLSGFWRRTQTLALHRCDVCRFCIRA